MMKLSGIALGFLCMSTTLWISDTHLSLRELLDYVGHHDSPSADNDSLFRTPAASRRTDLLVQKHRCRSGPAPITHDRHFIDGGTLRVGLKEDDLLYGRSCHFEYEGMERDWICRDCGTECRYGSYGECPRMNRTGRAVCGVIKRNPWDDPSLVTVKHQEASAGNSHYEHLYEHAQTYPNEGQWVERLPCKGGILDPECFDLTRCDPRGPMKVYIYGENRGQGANYTRSLQKNHPGLIEVVTNASEACLKVVSCDLFSAWRDEEMFVERNDHLKLVNHPDWDEGRNHFIWRSYRCFRDNLDYLHGIGISFQRAAISTPNINRIQSRYGYDISLPYYRRGNNDDQEFRVNASMVADLDDLHRPRRYLVFFKGVVWLAHNYWGYQHRWLATEYWPDDDDEVLADLRCGRYRQYQFPYEQYFELLKNSTFAFCPGGLSQGTFRFHESLAAGAIPVVTNDFLAPFEPELDWSGCLVRVSEARVLEIPRLLRELYTPADIRERQLRCRQLFENAIGWDKSNAKNFWQIDHGRQGFEMAMKVWASRVKSAFVVLGHRNGVLDG